MNRLIARLESRNRIRSLTRRLVVLCAAGSLVAALAACEESGGNEGDEADATAAFDGSYDGTDQFEVDLTVRDTSPSGGAPLSDTCSGSVEIDVDHTVDPVVMGTGTCLTSANAASFVLEADLDPDTGDLDGEIVITFSLVDHVVPLAGQIDGDDLEATFVGTTPQTASIVIDWDGGLTATFDE